MIWVLKVQECPGDPRDIGGAGEGDPRQRNISCTGTAGETAQGTCEGVRY